MSLNVPEIVFKTRVRDESIGGDNPFRWQDVTTNDIFKGKKVVVFALPGAYTPTCSSTHLPGFDEKYQAGAQRELPARVLALSRLGASPPSAEAAAGDRPGVRRAPLHHVHARDRRARSAGAAGCAGRAGERANDAGSRRRGVGATGAKRRIRRWTPGEALPLPPPGPARAGWSERDPGTLRLSSRRIRCRGRGQRTAGDRPRDTCDPAPVACRAAARDRGCSSTSEAPRFSSP